MVAVIDTRRVSIAGGSLHVRVAGPVGPAAADPIVLVHGGPGLSHRYMLGLEMLARDDRAVVSYDQRGCGRSAFASDDADDYGLDAQAADLGAILDAVGARQAHVLGMSWGGVVAMDFAGRCPERVTSLLLVDSCPPTAALLATGYDRFVARLDDLTARGLVPANRPHDPTANLRAILPVYFADPSSPCIADAVEAIEVSPIAADRTAYVLPTLDLTDRVEAYAGPVLVLFGAADPFGVEWAEAIAAAYAHARVRLEILDGCGHLPWVECPARFAAIAEAFLAR